MQFYYITIHHLHLYNILAFLAFKFEQRFHMQRYFFIFTYLINLAVMQGVRYFMRCELILLVGIIHSSYLSLARKYPSLFKYYRNFSSLYYCFAWFYLERVYSAKLESFKFCRRRSLFLLKFDGHV